MSILTLGHFCYKVTLQCEDTQLCATFREPKAQCQIWSLFLFFRWYTSISAYNESCTVDQEIFAIKKFSPVAWAAKIKYRIRALHCGTVRWQKLNARKFKKVNYFYHENFPIYGDTCTSTQVDSGSLLYTLAPHVTACQCKHSAIIGSNSISLRRQGL